jgi:hypothetical protein
MDDLRFSISATVCIDDQSRADLCFRESNNNNNDNNIFTWSGPSGVLGCTRQRPVGPPSRGSAAKTQSDGCHAVPLNPLIRWATRNLRGGKDYDSGLRKGNLSHTRIPLTLNRPSLVCIQLRTRSLRVPEKERSQLARKLRNSSMATAHYVGLTPIVQRCRSNYKIRKKKKPVC